MTNLYDEASEIREAQVERAHDLLNLVRTIRSIEDCCQMMREDSNSGMASHMRELCGTLIYITRKYGK